MAKISPDKLIIRCYGRRKGDKWLGVCLNFNLATEADSSAKLIKKMNEIIRSYLKTVYNTENKSSIPELISRKAPLRDWCTYYLIRSSFVIRIFLHRCFTFYDAIPIRVAVGSC